MNNIIVIISLILLLLIVIVINLKKNKNKLEKFNENNKKKIALLIPGTSNKREWTNIQESDLYKKLLKSLIIKLDNRYNFKIYFGIDKGDKIYDNVKNQNFIKNYIKNVNIDIDFIIMDIKKGYLSLMWNKLFKIAFNDNYDYFYQCGDDIIFNDKNMFHESISILNKNNNIGVSGSLTTNANNTILTQSLVSRKHMKIFGFYFPSEIKNWYVDRWISDIYKPKYYLPLKKASISNDGGSERYNIEHIDAQKIVEKYKPKIIKNINEYKYDTTIILNNVDKLSLQYIKDNEVDQNKLFSKGSIQNYDLQEENLLILKKFFDTNKIDYFIDCGTLLGAIREGNIIRGDEDADLHISINSVQKLRNNLHKLEKLGFISFRNNYTTSLLPMSLLRKGEYIDMYTIFNTPDFPIELDNYPFLGTQFKVPKYYDDWLTELYGNWRKPESDNKGSGNWLKGMKSYLKKHSINIKKN